MSKEILIKNCNECCFLQYDDCSGSYCGIDTNIDDIKISSYDENFIPGNCPILINDGIEVKIQIGSIISKENFIKMQQLQGIFKDDVNQLRELYKKIQ